MIVSRLDLSLEEFNLTLIRKSPFVCVVICCCACGLVLVLIVVFCC